MLGLPQTQAQVSAAAPAAPAASSSGFSFHDFLSIINPLQHLPVIGTLYRAVTGDTIGTPEKIAGDTLYGGLWGAVASIADAAFEKITGKDVGDTVLALFTGKHDSQPIAVAANTPFSASTAPASTVAAPVAAPAPGADYIALTAALARNGVDSDLSQRALRAYQKSMALPANAAFSNTVLAAAQ
jgi:hypothetical protein